MQKELYQKFFPDSFTLETPRVLLRLLKQDDYELLRPLTKDHDTWKFFTKDLYEDAELKLWIEEALEGRRNFNRMPFLVIDKDVNQVAGSTSFGNISFYDKRIEIGWSWLGTEFMGTGLNRHAKFALMCHAFEAMQMERVEIKTDVLNERSRKAILKIGMYEEGILRSHQQMHSNRRRDTVYYSIIRDEWLAVKMRFFSDLV
jgi:RimJ/RimL family protein N-acetyltransferase